MRSISRNVVLLFHLIALHVTTIWQRGPLMVLALLVALIVSWGSVYLFATWKHAELLNKIQQISHQLDLSWSNESPVEQLVILGNDALLAKQTAHKLKEHLRQQAREIESLKEEEYFYRSVIAPEDKTSQLEIFLARLGERVSLREYPIELVIRSSTGGAEIVQGSIALFLRGVQENKEKTLDVSAILDGQARMSFKYFQRFNTYLRIPEGFEPWSLVVRVTSKKRGQAEKIYRWGDLMQARSPS